MRWAVLIAGVMLACAFLPQPPSLGSDTVPSRGSMMLVLVAGLVVTRPAPERVGP